MDGGHDPSITIEASAGTPLLAVDGFEGPLERLLALARAQQIDLLRLPLQTVVDQLVIAVRAATRKLPLGQKGDWVVMAAWLVLLRSRLLLPDETKEQREARAEADQLRDRMLALREMQALALWLDHRPQLGLDVFARGQPELMGSAIETKHEVNVVEFLWSSLALFDTDATGPNTTSVYRPPWYDLHSVIEARERILLLLAATPQAWTMDQLLPAPGAEAGTGLRLRRRSAWVSTFVASLELTKQGDVRLVQAGAWRPIRVSAGGGEGLLGSV